MPAARVFGADQRCCVGTDITGKQEVEARLLAAGTVFSDETVQGPLFSQQASRSLCSSPCDCNKDEGSGSQHELPGRRLPPRASGKSLKRADARAGGPSIAAGSFITPLHVPMRIYSPFRAIGRSRH